jgi:hypothetical protein
MGSPSTDARSPRAQESNTERNVDRGNCREHAADWLPTESIKISTGIISSPRIQPHYVFPNAIMPGDETRQHHSDESDSEVEEEEEIPFVEVDVTKLTALSPEVISKQVRLL